MEGHQQLEKSRVVNVDSEETWDLLITRAKNQGCLVVAHFTAAWCRPSVAMKPYLEELSLQHKNIWFLSLDVDEVKEVSSKMEIKAMPTFLLMREGAQLVDKIVGANPDEIRKRIARFA